MTHEMDKTEAAMAYRMVASMHRHPWCWFCGRGKSEEPAGWFGPWLIERAHIVNNPRREDVRAVILLCSLCHRAQHGQVIVLGEPCIAHPLTLENMLWLKRAHDPDNYDREYLQRHYIGALPYAKRPNPAVQRQYKARRGQAWKTAGVKRGRSATTPADDRDSNQ